ncbi:MAG: hypothetical protein EA400_09380 [Chromatiaceae bacterium]|nr:MAG: hypothetical protein EA400_09380 [Chromatiaceae bacterium]
MTLSKATFATAALLALGLNISAIGHAAAHLGAYTGASVGHAIEHWQDARASTDPAPRSS